jgi:hypothetical protein
MRSFSSKYLLPALAGLFLMCIWAGGSSCKKEKLLTSGGEIRFSTDTVAFDTVFTTLGSATQIIRIFNKQDQKIVLSSVRVAGGDASFFSLNVDGRPGKAVSNVEIAANDSVYVFATVKIDPTNENTPFIIEDKLIATLNGSDFSIPMIAYGQNAHFVKDSLLSDPSGTISWGTDKPYVIFGYAIVDAGQTLNIPAGCRVYMHANARLFVDGTLKAIGTKKDTIIFQGDRLDRAYFGYEGYPGEWGGLYFTSHSSGSILEHVVLRNGGNGAQGAPPAMIEVEPDSVNNQAAKQLTLKKVIIENSIGYGLLAFKGTVIAENCLIHSCGASALALLMGGNYQFDYCTITTYGSNKISHTDNPAAVILNYFIRSQTETDTGALSAVMRNCVVAGSLTNEFIADSLAPVPASLLLDHCILKAEPDKTRPWVAQNAIQYLSGNTPGYDSLFKSVMTGDYHPASTSLLIGKGTPVSAIADDLDDVARSGASAVGCYTNP